MNAYRYLLAAVVLTLAAVLQMTTAWSLAIGPARPDILLTAIICVSLLVELPAAAAAGLWGGLLMATLVGVNYGSFLVSRSMTGAVCGRLAEQPLRENLLIAPIITFAATFVCEGAYYAMAPSHRGVWWIERVALEALYNLVLSVPLTLLLRKAGLKRAAAGAFDGT
jgi:hypothetical protein